MQPPCFNLPLASPFSHGDLQGFYRIVFLIWHSSPKTNQECVFVSRTTAFSFRQEINSPTLDFLPYNSLFYATEPTQP